MIAINRPLVVTDTETTGLYPLRNRIIEIGAIRLLDGEEPISFSELIDPGEAIPSRITRLTGITSSMVFGCPDASVVIPTFEEFLGNGILVAHNLKFDRGFLDAERARLGLEPLQNQGLCTVRLARRLLPGLRSKSLGSLARFFRIAPHGRHRALRDVEITAEVLLRLMEIAQREHKVDALDELLSMQSRTYARINPFSQHILRIRREELPDVPDDPGIYRMMDGRGRVLYVGKAKVLSRRVRSYFNAIEAHTPRIRELISKVRKLDWMTTGTELEALLLESRLIRELDPPFNRAQRRTTPRPFLRIAGDEPFPRILANVFPRNDGAEYYGPLRSRGEARALLEVLERFFPVRTCDDRELSRGRRCLRADIGRCLAPCETPDNAASYAQTLEDVRAFLSGDVSNVLEQLESEMLLASSTLAFEEAARLRDLKTTIENRIDRNGQLVTRIFEDDAVVLHADQETGAKELFFIRAGRLVASETDLDVDREEFLYELQQRLREVYEEALPLDADGLQEGANEIRVLLHWLYANRDNLIRLDIDSDARIQPGADADGAIEAYAEKIQASARAFFAPVIGPDLG